MFTPEQMIAAQKNNVEAFFGLAQKTFTGVEKLVELNLKTTREVLDQATKNAQSLLAVKDVQELVSIQSGLLQPQVEKAATYGRQVYDITAGAANEAGKAAEANIAEAQSKLNAAVDAAVKNAPAGTESLVAMVKSSVAAANNAYDTVSKAAKQAADVAEANMQAVTSSAVKATEQATKAARRTTA